MAEPRGRDLAAVPGAAGIADETQLAARFWNRIRYFALKRIRDTAGADDVAQETLRRVILALREARIQNPSSLPSFVLETAHHICLQHRRSADREARALERFVREEPSPAGDPDPLRSLISAERGAVVRAALDRLEAQDRELLRLLFYEDQDNSSVAERLRISQAALRVRKHRVLRRLAELLKGDPMGNDSRVSGTWKP